MCVMVYARLRFLFVAKENNMLEAKYMDIAELQQYMKIGRNKAYTLVKKPDFPSIRVGSKILIDKKKLDKYLDSHSQT